MPRAVGTKEERLQLRLDADSKSVLRRAADYRHKSVSQFVLGSALEEAERVIRENEVVTLSAADWEIFYEALVNPPEPTAVLQEAYARYKAESG